MDFLSNNSQQKQNTTNNPQKQQPQQGNHAAEAQGGMGGLFGGDQKNNNANNQKIDEISSEIKSLTTRIRAIEEKYRNIRATLQMNEKNSLEETKKVNTELKDFNQQLFQLKKSFNQMSSKMDIIIKELGLTAKKENVEAIEKYLNLWNPVNFVSQKEVVHVVKRALLELGIESKADVKIKDDYTPDKAMGEKPQPFDEEGM